MHKSKKSFITFSIFITIVISIPNFTVAATYYVSTSGSAVWTDCLNVATPCSWHTAITNAQAGDTVYFRAGVYDPGNAANYETPAMNPANSGTAGNPIIFKAYPGESPVLTGNTIGPVIGSFNRNYITWDGFTSTQVDTGGVNFLVGIFQSNHIIIRNCDLTGLNADDHQNNALIFADTADYLTIENNLIHDSNGLLPGDPDYVEAAVNSAGIILYSTSYATVKNNDFYNNYIGIFDKDAGNYNKHLNNHIWGGAGSDTCYYGVKFGNEQGGGNSTNVEYYQNIIRNCITGIFSEAGAGGLGSTIISPKIYNNTLIGSGGDWGIFITLDKAIRSAEIYNNIIINYARGLGIFSSPATYSFIDYNAYNNVTYWNYDGYFGTDYLSISSWQTARGYDVHSLTVAAGFINLSGSVPDDFRLKTSSFLKGNGRGGEDIGAYPSLYGNKIGYKSSRRPVSVSVTIL